MPQNIQNEGQLRKNLLSEPTPTEKPNYMKYLENIGKILTLVSTLGLIIGCGMAFVYFKNVDFISVFPDVMRDPSSLIAVIVVIAVMILILSLGFISPYLLIQLLDIAENYTIRSLSHKIILFLTLNLTNIYCLSKLIAKFLKWEWVTEWNWVILILLLLFIFFALRRIILIVPSFWKWNSIQIKTFFVLILVYIKIDFKKYINIAIKFIIITIKFISSALWINLMPIVTLWFFFPILDKIDDEISQYLVISGYCVLSIFNNLIVVSFLSSYSQNRNSPPAITPYLVISLMLVIPLLAVISLRVHNFPSYVFTPIRFTEKPDNSSWYLLHNNFQKNDGTQEVSGIEKADLLRLKEKFKVPFLCHIADARNNALYGYMAWNLGNTKVFCPASVRNDENAKCQDKNKDGKCSEKEQNDANKTAFSQCLVIDGKFLQIMDEQYIGMPEKENNVSDENLQTERTISNLPSDIKIRQ